MRLAGMLALLSAVILVGAPAGAQPPARITESPATSGLSSAMSHVKWTGDLDGMIKRRMIRVLVPYSKTYYFVDRAVQRGISYDVTRLLEADLNRKLKTGHIRLSVLCIPVNRGQMIPGLLEGQGDIAMGNLTITPERHRHAPTGRAPRCAAPWPRPDCRRPRRAAPAGRRTSLGPPRAGPI